MSLRVESTSRVYETLMSLCKLSFDNLAFNDD